MQSTVRALLWQPQMFSLKKHSNWLPTHVWLLTHGFSDSFLWNWLIPLWMPNWYTVLKAALSALVFLFCLEHTQSVTSTPWRWPQTELPWSCEGLQECSRVVWQKTEIKYSSFKVYREITETKIMCILSALMCPSISVYMMYTKRGCNTDNNISRMCKHLMKGTEEAGRSQSEGACGRLAPGKVDSGWLSSVLSSWQITEVWLEGLMSPQHSPGIQLARCFVYIQCVSTSL